MNTHENLNSQIGDMIKKLSSIDKELSDVVVRKAMYASCMLVKNTAKQNITEVGAVDTGRLRQSLAFTTRVLKKEIIGDIGTNVEYAAWVELGTGEFTPGGRKGGWSFKNEKGEWVFTRGMRPRPYLTPALLTNKGRILSIFEDYLKKALSEIDKAGKNG